MFVVWQVDGELKQRGSTGDMLFDIPHLINYISGIMTLDEGDLIVTGERQSACLLQSTLSKAQLFHLIPFPFR
jgi:2-keto-4-pentenoate hydratase/2-oxohepta-3-ene-1,7-dioic acid hydratase in catechol pathway